MVAYTPRVAADDARRVVLATTGRTKERTPLSILFIALLWLSLLVAFVTLVTLLVDTFLDGQARLDGRLFTEYPSSRPEEAGARPAILGSLWVIGTTALLAVPLGVAAAVHLEEFGDKKSWFNRLIEVNISNLSAVPAIIYGMLALGTLALLGVGQKNIVIGGALALAMLILPVVIISTR
jgi:ABC-type phosphate transport system permease subunit